MFFNIASVKLAESDTFFHFKDEWLCRLTTLETIHFLERIEEFDAVIIKQSFKETSSSLFELILKIKNQSSIPIWVYSEKKHRLKPLLNLELGVLGNMWKDTSPDEVKLMIVNILKSIHGKAKIGNIGKFEERKQSEFENYQVSHHKGCLIVDGDKEISLTRLEYKLCNTFYRTPGKVLSYEEIHNILWPETKFKEEQIQRISNVVFHLRKKVEMNGGDANFIKTMRSVGYYFNN